MARSPSCASVVRGRRLWPAPLASERTHVKRRETSEHRSMAIAGRLEPGSAGRTRTYNQWINSPLLCQLSYRGMAPNGAR